MHEVGTHSYKEAIENSSMKNIIVEINNSTDRLNTSMDSAKE